MTTATTATITLDVSRVPEGWGWTIAQNWYAGAPFFAASVTYPKPTAEKADALGCQQGIPETPQATLHIAMLKAKGVQ